MRKKIFVLGGTGFIGSELLKSLKTDLNKYEVLALINKTTPYKELESFNTYTGDLRDFDLKILGNFNPDIIIHMARIGGKGRIGRYLSAKKGAKANQRIIKYLIENGMKPHVIYVSGTLVYGDCKDLLVDEDTPINPTGFAKQYIIAEKPWMECVQNGEIPTSILRPPWIVGKKSWFKNFILDYVKKNNTIPQFGNGENWMSLIDVEDCAGLVKHAAEKAEPGKCYNLCIPGIYVTLKDFVEKVSYLKKVNIRKMEKKEVIQEFDSTIYEAFTFSLKSGTKEQEFLSSYQFKYQEIDEILLNNIN
jgi:nucleoside-diphosphate-sugar epimerase